MTTTLEAGTARADITPPMGVEMSGYGAYQKRLATEVLDPLSAKALWLRANGQDLLILTVDLITITLEIRSRLIAELASQTGIDEAAVMIAASHTHSGPAVSKLIAWGKRDEDYLATLTAQLIEIALAAHASLQPARFAACRERITDVGVNRDQPDIGPTDPSAQLLRVDDENGDAIALLYNYGAHPVSRYPLTNRISADWPGLVSARLEDLFPDATAFFLQGACGNINLGDMKVHGTDRIRNQCVADARTGASALRFGDQVLPIFRGLKTDEGAAITTVQKTIDLPCDVPSVESLNAVIDEHLATAEHMEYAALPALHDRLGSETDAQRDWRLARYQVDRARYQLSLIDRGVTSEPALVQVFKLGDVVIVGWPAEVYVELGMELRQRSPFPMTFVTTFSNHCVGYIPTAAAYESTGHGNDFGAYPKAMTPGIFRTLPFVPEVGRILVTETLDILWALEAEYTSNGG